MSAKMAMRRVRSLRVVVVVLLTWIGLVVALSGLLAASQAHARRDVAQRLAARIATGAEFASLYVRDIEHRERHQATSWLTGRRVSAENFARVSDDMGFTSSVLLDHHGRVLQIVPPTPALLGHVISGGDPHLPAGEAGRVTVSSVVPSAAIGVPVVSLAMPFHTASGRRVFRGGFDVSQTPLGVYMSHMLALPGRRVYLADAGGRLIASTGPKLKTGETLAQLDGRLAATTRAHATGSYASPRGSQAFVTANVSGTPWRIVAAVPEAQLYASVDGANRWLAWGAVASLALVGLLTIMLGSRLIRSRQRLAALNGELDRLAHVDSLTGVRNRRDIEATLRAEIGVAQRRNQDLAVLLIDIDHFKRINDTHGHQAGDAALLDAGQAMRSALRADDTIGRWGGEEFLAVLPATDAQGAVSVAHRLQAGLAAESGKANAPTALTVTIGAAVLTTGTMDDLIRRADAALYAGKTAGRNNVQINADLPGHRGAARTPALR